jgi:hypothetical protein
MVGYESGKRTTKIFVEIKNRAQRARLYDMKIITEQVITKSNLKPMASKFLLRTESDERDLSASRISSLLFYSIL